MGKTHTKPRISNDKPILPKRQARNAGGQGEDSNHWGATLVGWYRLVHRKLPWRAEPGVCHDPYRTWLSEIMLQQTTVVTVIPYYQKFLDRWPTVFDLARADEADVLREWAGLGYYARGRNLLKGARVVVDDYNGVFPADLVALQKIPGIGPYTASAVGAMAFGLKTVPVDGNVERVMTRFYEIKTPLQMAKTLINNKTQSVLDGSPGVFSGDLAQAFMDLGATVCTPKSPKCGECPVRSACSAFAAGTVAHFPVMAPKVEKPTRRGDVYVLRDKSGRYLTVRRAGQGLLAGMPGFPTTYWDGNDVLPPAYKNETMLGDVRHSFTHFNLILRVVHGTVRSGVLPVNGEWYDREGLENLGLPKLFLKVMAMVKKEI